MKLVKNDDKLIDIAFDLINTALRYGLEDLLVIVLRFILIRMVKIETSVKILNLLTALEEGEWS